MLRVVFTTRPTNFISMAIRTVLNEPVSHCGIEYKGHILHSDFLRGVHWQPISEFYTKNEIVYSVYVGEPPEFLYKTIKYSEKKYDYLGFIMLGLRYLLPKKWTKKQNINHITGTFMCHELVNSILTDEEKTLLTPFKLYTYLKKREG